jgi:uncharacterized protein YecT (DUF1311 family)
MNIVRLAASALAAGVVLATLMPGASTAAEKAKLDAKASAAIESCVRSAGAKLRQAERCTESIAGPCLKRPGAQSTAAMVDCAAREAAVWDDILNETFRRLRDKLNDEQKNKLREMQRAWIESRDRSCGFYRDYH